MRLEFSLLHRIKKRLSKDIKHNSVVLRSLLSADKRPGGGNSIRLAYTILDHDAVRTITLIDFRTLVTAPFGRSGLGLDGVVPCRGSINAGVVKRHKLKTGSNLPRPRVKRGAILSFIVTTSLKTRCIRFNVRQSRPFSRSIFEHTTRRKRDTHLMSQFRHRKGVPQGTHLYPSSSRFSQFTRIPSRPRATLCRF